MHSNMKMLILKRRNIFSWNSPNTASFSIGFLSFTPYFCPCFAGLDAAHTDIQHAARPSLVELCCGNQVWTVEPSGHAGPFTSDRFHLGAVISRETEGNGKGLNGQRCLSSKRSAVGVFSFDWTSGQPIVDCPCCSLFSPVSGYWANKSLFMQTGRPLSSLWPLHWNSTRASWDTGGMERFIWSDFHIPRPHSAHFHDFGAFCLTVSVSPSLSVRVGSPHAHTRCLFDVTMATVCVRAVSCVMTSSRPWHIESSCFLRLCNG